MSHCHTFPFAHFFQSYPAGSHCLVLSPQLQAGDLSLVGPFSASPNPFVPSPAMAALMVAVLILAMTGHSSSNWCVCKQGIADNVLQKTLDYACGAGADCNPVKQNGPCFNPNTVRAHCNYAVNSYFQRKGQAQSSCDFAGTAAVSTADPSTAGCAYPSSASATGSTTTTQTPATTNPNTATPSSTATPGAATPYTGTPTGVLGGVGNGSGLTPSGTGANTDYSHAGLGLHGSISLVSFTITLVILGLMFS